MPRLRLGRLVLPLPEPKPLLSGGGIDGDARLLSAGGGSRRQFSTRSSRRHYAGAGGGGSARIASMTALTPGGSASSGGSRGVTPSPSSTPHQDGSHLLTPGAPRLGDSDRAGARSAEDFASPALIRKSLLENMFKRASKPQTNIPGFYDLVTGKLALVTNWSTFYDDIYLDDCTQIVHFPFVDVDEHIGNDFSACIIFAPRKGELAVATSLAPEALRSLCKSPVFGTDVIKALEE